MGCPAGCTLLCLTSPCRARSDCSPQSRDLWNSRQRGTCARPPGLPGRAFPKGADFDPARLRSFVYSHQLPCQRAHSEDPAEKQCRSDQRLLGKEEDEAGLCPHGLAGLHSSGKGASSRPALIFLRRSTWCTELSRDPTFPRPSLVLSLVQRTQQQRTWSLSATPLWPGEGGVPRRWRERQR